MAFGFKKFAMVMLAGAALVSAAGCGINTIPTKEEAAKAAWADVQGAYQRRADLVPNLVSTVQAAANQEQETLQAVVEARASATRPQFDASTITDPAKFAEFQAAQGQLSAALGKLMVIQEQYPQLRSQEGFLQLQNELSGTENRIQVARRDYNEAVRSYNTELRTFPSVIWANTLHSGSKPMELFAASAAAQEAPKVEFK
ncbi:MAG: LemA family protein [Hyphomonadaceae bacterium]|jgi:LemA protein|nr:LemA family protein [Hyphomonadaceae bacterium]